MAKLANRRVVVTGLGAVCSLGTTLAEIWTNCLAGHSVVTAIPEHWHEYSHFHSKIWAPLPKIDFVARGVPRIELLRTDPVSLLAYITALEALDNAQLILEKNQEKAHSHCVPGLDSQRTGIYMGTSVGGISSLLENQAHQILANTIPQLSAVLEKNNINEGFNEELRALAHLQYPQRFNTFVVSMLMPNAVSAFLGLKLSLNGPNNTVALACASGSAAIGQAFHAIRNGQVDAAICGASDYLYDRYGGCFRGFDVAKTLVNSNEHPDYANCPFDKNRSGFLFSEAGAATLILEEYEHAVARKAPIVAEITGYGETFDSYNMLRPDPSGDQATRAIQLALGSAGLCAKDIDYINAHGTGTHANDLAESNIIRNYFPCGPLVNSTKSLAGHTIGASGAIEAVISAMSIQHQTTHACHNLVQAIGDLNYVLKKDTFSIDKVLSLSFAFGGHNAALVMQKLS